MTPAPLPVEHLFVLLFAVLFSFHVERIATTVLEAINKVGSMANGPLLSLFIVAILFPAVGQRAAIGGFIAGLATNMVLWLEFPQVSWLWWNVAGCLTGLGVALAVGGFRQHQRAHIAPGALSVPLTYTMTLLLAALVIFGFCVAFTAGMT